MVEMSDHVACNTVIQCLGGQQLFGNQIDFRFVFVVLFMGGGGNRRVAAREKGGGTGAGRKRDFQDGRNRMKLKKRCNIS